MKGRTWILLIGLVVLSGIAAGALWLRDRVAAEGPGPGIILASGRIEVREVRVAAAAAGRVLRMAVREGDALTADQLIAELDGRSTEAATAGASAAVEAAEANVAVADRKIAALESQLALARMEAERYRRLFERDAAPRQAAERAEAALAQLENEQRAARAARTAAALTVEMARAQLRTADIQLDETTVVAPVSGVVEVVLIRAGEMVAAGMPLVVIRRTDDVRVRVYVPLAEAQRVRPGLDARVYVEGDARRFVEGRVERVANEAEFTPKDVHMPDERATLVFAVDIRINDTEVPLGDGFPADVYIRWDPSADWPAESPW